MGLLLRSDFGHIELHALFRLWTYIWSSCSPVTVGRRAYVFIIAPGPRRPLLSPTGSSWIVAALAPSSVVRTARPVTPTVKLVAITARGEQDPRPGRLDAAEARGRTPGRPAVGRVPRDRDDRGDGRQPGLIHRPGLRLAAVPRNAGATGPARPPPAVTLSDAGGQEECAPSRLTCIRW